MPSNMPALVLTPLPPLNFSQMGQLWPATAAMPHARSSQLGAPETSSGKQNAGTKPLTASRTNAATPQLLPTHRNTFVAPMLPEPTFCRSMPFRRAMSNPLGIDPNR